MRFLIEQHIDLAQENAPMVYAQPLIGGDSNAHEWRVTVTKRGVKADIPAGSVTAYVRRDILRDDWEEEPALKVSGSASGNVISVVLPADVYAMGCPLVAVVRVASTDGSAASVAVLRATSEKLIPGAVYDPDGEVMNLDALLAQIQATKDAAAAANAAAEKANAAASHAPYVGEDGYWYVWDSGVGKYVGTGIPATGPEGPQGPPGQNGIGSGTVTGVKIGDETYEPNDQGVVELPETGSGVADSVAWGNVTGKPDTYPPASHTHPEYLGKNETAVNANQLNGKSADEYATVEQLNNKQLTGLVNSSTDIYTRNEPMYPGIDIYGTDQEGNKNFQGSIRLSMNTDHDGFREIELLDRNSSKVCLILTSEYGTAADSYKLDGKDSVYYHKRFSHPRNLLDNSDFRNPVNQRGRTGYVGNGYTIDRWVLWGDLDTESLAIENGYIALNPETGSIVTLAQRFAKGYLDENKTYTLAYADTRGNIHTINNPVRHSDEIDYVEIFANEWIGVLWAALYEGSYTADNLPPYVPKGYAAELAECQRYYLPRVGMNCSGFITAEGRARIFIPTNGLMRATPTIVVNTYDNIVGNASGSTLVYALNSVLLDVESQTGIIVLFETDLAAGQYTFLPVATFGTCLTLDADL